jgi:hypothetical protein
MHSKIYIISMITITTLYLSAGLNLDTKTFFPDTINFVFKEDASLPDQVILHYGIRQCTLTQNNQKKIAVNKDTQDTGTVYIDCGYKREHYVIEYPTRHENGIDNTYYIAHTIIINDLPRYASGRKPTPGGFKIYEYKYLRDGEYNTTH